MVSTDCGDRTLPASGRSAAPLMAALTFVLCTSGCRWINRDRPATPEVMGCRQLSQRGIAAIDAGDWPAAENLLKQAIETCPVDAEARSRYAETLRHRGAMPEAVVQIEEAIRLAPNEGPLHVRAGEMYLALGRLGDARRRAERALDIDPRLTSAWTLRGRVYAAGGESEQALADFHRALSYQHDDSALLLETAEVYRRLNRPARALTAIQSLRDTYAPGEVPQRVCHLEGLALQALGRHREATASFWAAIQRAPPTAEIYCHLAESQLLAGQADDAGRAIAQALAIDPHHRASRALAEQIDRARLSQIASRPE